MPPRHPPRRRGNAHDRRQGQAQPARRSPAPSNRQTPAQDLGSTKPNERLQKALAHAGIGSRRACEELILQGRVTVDGKVVRELGTKVDPRRSEIAVDGQRVRVERPVYYAVNKPKGYVSTNNDPSGRPRVVDLLPEIPQRVYTVGRLDEMSTGLMLLTNDGELANRLAHPKFGVEKLYRAVVAGTPDREVLSKLTEGVWLAEGKVRAKRVRIAGKKGESTVLEMVLAEGKNREVRRMLARLGHKVMTLTRTAVGPITLKGLAPGASRPLSAHEVDLLHKAADGVSVGPAPRGDARPRRPGRPGAPQRTNAGGSRAPGRKGGQDKPAQAGGPPRKAAGANAANIPPSQRRPARSGAPPRKAPRADAAEIPPSQRRPPRPEPSARRQAPASEPTGRRIIGLNLGSESNGPRRTPPKGRRKPPRSGLGPRRPGPSKRDEGDES